MNRWFSILLAAYVAVHAALGCCWHHAHGAGGRGCDHSVVVASHDNGDEASGCHSHGVNRHGVNRHASEQLAELPLPESPPPACVADRCEFVSAPPRAGQTADFAIARFEMPPADMARHGLSLSALYDRVYLAEHDAAGPLRAHLRLGVLLI